MSFSKNSRVYYLAVVVYCANFLFGYDTGIAGGVVTQPAFKNAFGLQGNAARVNDLSSNVVAVLQAGGFFGALFSAPLTHYIGRKWSIEVASIVLCIGAILTTVASHQIGLIYAGRIISGLGIGAISALAPTYVAECAPRDVRGRITGLFQFVLAIGVLISYFLNYGVNLHITSGPAVWRIAFGFQLVPAGLAGIGVLFCKESPRWLASKGRTAEALKNLAWLRKSHVDDVEVRAELAEIEAQIEEERLARKSLGLKELFFGKGNWPRFLIAFLIFTLQQWSGQNTVGYYAPQIFQAIGYNSNSASLLASGYYGMVKVIATGLCLVLAVEQVGRRKMLIWGGFAMGVLFYIVGAILKAYPPSTGTADTPSKAMAAMIYLYCVAYSFSWGPLPWVYVADIFSTRTRHYGLSFAAATQWAWNYGVSKLSLIMKANLGWKMFITFGTINIGGMALFAFFLPETAGRSLEEMDIIFGAVNEEKRVADIQVAKNAIDHDVLHLEGAAGAAGGTTTPSQEDNKQHLDVGNKA